MTPDEKYLNRQSFIDTAICTLHNNTQGMSNESKLLLLITRMVNRPDLIPKMIADMPDSTLVKRAGSAAMQVNEGASPDELIDFVTALQVGLS